MYLVEFSVEFPNFGKTNGNIFKNYLFKVPYRGDLWTVVNETLERESKTMYDKRKQLSNSTCIITIVFLYT